MRVISVLLLALLFVLAARQLTAQIYRNVDPETGLTEYTNAPKKGSERLNANGQWENVEVSDKAIVDAKKEVAQSKKEADAAIKRFYAQLDKVKSDRAKAMQQLAKDFPACREEKTCQLSVGMPTNLAVAVFPLRRVATAQTETFTRTTYRHENCRAIDESNKIVAIYCGR